MKQTTFLLLAMATLMACSTTQKTAGGTYGSPKVKQELYDEYTFKITQFSLDSTYGYTQANPINVGGTQSGPLNERRFLNALVGPNGQTIEYSRQGSCCHFKTKNSEGGIGLLDIYNINYKGLSKSITLYINMYDSDTLKVPVGFMLKHAPNATGSTPLATITQ